MRLVRRRVCAGAPDGFIIVLAAERSQKRKGETRQKRRKDACEGAAPSGKGEGDNKNETRPANRAASWKAARWNGWSASQQNARELPRAADRHQGPWPPPRPSPDRHFGYECPSKECGRCAGALSSPERCPMSVQYLRF